MNGDREAYLEKQLEKALRTIAELTKTVEEQQLKILNLEHQNQALLRRIFGSSSEKFDPAQLSLFEPEDTKKPEAADASAEEDAPAAKPTRRGKQQRLKKSMENLPTTTEVIEPEEVQQAPHEWKCIGEEITEELHYQPAGYSRHQIIRPKYVRREESIEENNVAIAALPPRLLAGSVLTSSLLAGIVADKYLWHQPLNRREQLMNTAGLTCSRSLMCHWLAVGAEKLRKLHEKLKQDLLASDYLQIDETPVRYLDPGSGKSQQGYLWAMHNPRIGVYYEWHTGRSHKHLLKVMEDGEKFRGVLQHDAYRPYLTLADDEGLPHTACMAHIRRRFEKALKDYPAIAGWFMSRFARLYEIESNLRRERAGPEARARRRQRLSRPILTLLKKAVLHLRRKHTILPKSPLGEALHYALEQLPHMDTWLEHGQVEIDNNLIENAMRPTKLGMKNWLFFGSAASGSHGAILYTMVENVRRLNRDPYQYLEWLFEQIRLDPKNADSDRLLPVSWAAAHPDGHKLRTPVRTKHYRVHAKGRRAA